MRIEPKPGEVWFADLGIAAKSRPVLVLAVPGDDDARALIVVAPLTSQIRGERGEVDLGKPRWLPKPSAVNVQGLASFDARALSRRLGVLSVADMDRVKAALRDLLDL
ncbi:MAG: type II toxin-antitoxin system PemK/MazF family toxin [Chthoniobacterales bacterium]